VYHIIYYNDIPFWFIILYVHLLRMSLWHMQSYLLCNLGYHCRSLLGRYHLLMKEYMWYFHLELIRILNLDMYHLLEWKVSYLLSLFRMMLYRFLIDRSCDTNTLFHFMHIMDHNKPIPQRSVFDIHIHMFHLAFWRDLHLVYIQLSFNLQKLLILIKGTTKWVCNFIISF